MVDSIGVDLMVPLAVINYNVYVKMPRDGVYDHFVDKNSQNRISK